jgi:AcrR family transcriptional regulator
VERRKSKAKDADIAPRKIPVQTRARQRVDRILDVTAELLAEAPLSELSTSAIAGRAGVPIGSIYQYFPNKLAVLAALARRVMDRVDRRTRREIAAVHALSWEEGVERAVEATMEAFWHERGYGALLRAIRTTPEFREITEESNAKIASMLASHPEVAELGIPEERVEVIASTAIEAANAVQDLALLAESPERSRQLVEEMKVLLKAYLGHYARVRRGGRREGETGEGA